uniref:Uncharacterized protein n=1 Tax=Melopsittacus undulatus TaxID=13146 RepID=A0A8C6J912_MELUD
IPKEQLQMLQQEFYHQEMIVPFLFLLTGACLCSLPQAVQGIINQVLEKLEESQVPMTDYALKSSGAAVIPEYTSPSYRSSAYKIVLFSLLSLDYVRSPELILEKENHPGNCWPFHGSQGHVLIKLSVPIIPRAVTMDHVSGPPLLKNGVSSAPKDFAVYVSDFSEWGAEGCSAFLSRGRNKSGLHHQRFSLAMVDQVLSNWGHPDYTCVYRFRVHGDPASKEGKVAL